MGLVELNLDFTDEHKATRDVLRKFGAELARPVAVQLDRLADPQAVIAPDSPYWDVQRAFRKLGFHRLGYPEEIGGLPAIQGAGFIVAEEMGYASADFAISFGCNGFPFRYALLSPDPAVRDLARQYMEDEDAKLMGCWAITEPDHGSDWIHAGGENARRPDCVPQLRAVKKGDRYILNGQKAAWVSNGTVATHAALFLCLEPSLGMAGGGIAVVPLDLPGISKGKPLDKMGQRALNQGEIFFDNVDLPEEYMVVKDPATFKLVFLTQLAGANGGMGPTFAGLAAAALDEALKYAKERVQGGLPIIEHQNVKLKLFSMFTKVEAARSLARRVVAYNTVTQPPALQYSIASKILATQTAFEVASEAIQIFGGVGLTKEYVIEKIFRDAKASMIEDGENSALALAGAEYL